MEYLFLIGKSGASGAWQDISLHPIPVVLGIIGICVFFWVIFKA